MKSLYIPLILLQFFACVANAQATNTLPETPEAFLPEKTSQAIPTMNEVKVVGQAEDQLSGSNQIDRTLLEALPSKNSSINEAISILPGIQLSEEGRPSTSAGEILPPFISISGGKPYQNNFIVDGATSNNLINPNSTNPKNMNFVPGHPQTLFLSTELVEKADVYRYNVPASFGNFSGGVIDVKTRDPESDFWGEIGYRTSRGSWTKFHLDPSIEDEFNSSKSETYQPDFKRHSGGITLNIPLSEELSLLTAYQLNYSEIPLLHIGEEKAQKRRNENFLAKLLWEPTPRQKILAQLQYSPYQGDYFTPDTKDSAYTIESDSLLASLKYKQELSFIDVSLYAAGKKSRSDRNAPTDLREWLANIDGAPSSKPWGNITGETTYGELVSSEGGIGPLESSQEGFQLNADFALKKTAHHSGQISHSINFGLGYEHVRGDFSRPIATNIYFLTAESGQSINADPAYIGDVICDPGAIDCISGEQVLLKRQHYPKGSSSATINFLDAYVEDTIHWKRLEFRPGVRVSHNDYMENLDIAPRLAAKYDLFNNKRTQLIAGWNRYYGKTLMYYKLREGNPPWRFETREVDLTTGIPKDWVQLTEYNSVYKYSKLKTPYTDELVLGVAQEIFEGRLKVNWVHRKGYDEFSQERTDSKQPDGFYHYTMTNLGRSEHDEYTLEWERYWESTYLGINATYQESTTTSDSYTEAYETEDLDDQVWYDGDILSIDEIPRQDFSRPWVANMIYSTKLPYNFTFTNIMKYRSGYEGLYKISASAEKTALGVPAGMTAYRKDKKDDSWVFDWRIDWEKRFQNSNALIVSLEINNVFNQEVESGTPSGQLPNSNPSSQDYELGRQFWLGMTYKF